jgi:hypothetical protein
MKERDGIRHNPETSPIAASHSPLSRRYMAADIWLKIDKRKEIASCPSQRELQ